MDIFRRSLAPITKEAWSEINQTAKDVLTASLSARKVVDVQGPMGLNYAAHPIGKINVPDNQSGALKYGIHQVQPMVETRIPFKLDIWELDNVARGSEVIDLDALEDAARKLAQFEENAIYEGFEHGYIKGIKKSSEYEHTFPENVEDVLAAVIHGMAHLKNNAIDGPYSLVLNTEKWEKVNTIIQGYPLRKQLENVMGGKIIHAPFVDSAFLVSRRGGDFRLILGQDITIGYEYHDANKVQLYLTESFTFQVIEPKAVIVFT
jgi:uncharacterized linocin/CFP29 family protein